MDVKEELNFFVKIKKKKIGGGGGWGGGSEGGGLVGGVRVDVNEELIFFCENSRGGGG